MLSGSHRDKPVARGRLWPRGALTVTQEAGGYRNFHAGGKYMVVEVGGHPPGQVLKGPWPSLVRGKVFLVGGMA